ncbi:MOSC domain-containing protein [Marinomonas agarivorans]|nr:MOSC domain-containing protein [Marinomonas agarivorans]
MLDSLLYSLIFTSRHSIQGFIVTAFLDDITIYPIKSTRGISLAQSSVAFAGLIGDRRYMLVNSEGKFVTARKDYLLSLIQVEHHGNDKLTLSYQDQQIVIDPDTFTAEYEATVIWKTDVQGQVCGKQYDEWFSRILGKAVRLVYFGDQSSRFTSRRPEQPVAFADGYPFLIASRASLRALAERCPEEVQMERFRPNIVIDGCEAFAEDTWAIFKIGDVVFETIKPCIRCIFTTLNPNTAEKSPQGEPFKTLCQFRQLVEDGKPQGPTFGMNLVALNEGVIKQGDQVKVLEYRTSEMYQDKSKA